MTTRSSKQVSSKHTARKARKVTVQKTKRAKRQTRKKTTPATSANTTPVTGTNSAPTAPRQPLGHLLLEKKLAKAGFRGNILSDKKTLDKYSYDESIFSVRPQLVLQPHDQKDVETAVSTIAAETKEFPALSLTPRAAGTGLSGGSLTDSVVIDVNTYMNKIGDITTRRGVTMFTCEPGAMWRDVEKKLKEKDCYIPSYPASKDICSIGGSVANNAAGPDSLRYGHCANWVESLEVTFYDGHTYTVEPLTYKELQTLIKKDNVYAKIAREVFALIEQNEKLIEKSRPHTAKNSAGYSIWDVLDVPIKEFKKGQGHFDLTRIISGSQGTLGIITSVTMRTKKIAHDTDLIVVPVFDLMDAGAVISRALKYEPVNIELFDSHTYDLAMKHPTFFKDRLGKMMYYQVLLSMYTTYHVRWARKTPDFTILITIDRSTTRIPSRDITADLKHHHGKRARLVTNPVETEMFWQIRRASYTLSKFQDTQKRPAAFLEDMAVPPQNLSKFFAAIKKLLKKYNVQAAVHGHGGNGHLHFYPLLDFTNKTTPKLVEKMADEFFATAIKFDGNLCGEHNDGIIRTPHLSKMFSKKALDLFTTLEHICDPDDIFNPGKKVNPRFDIKENLRTIN